MAALPVTDPSIALPQPGSPAGDGHRGPAEIASAAIKGDRDAWRELIQRYTCVVRGVTIQYRLSRSDSEDVSQIVWMRLWQNLHRIREPRALPMWIKTTASNEALKISQSNRRVSLMDPLDISHLEVQSDAAELADQLMRSEMSQALRDGLGALESKDRDLLVLLHAETPISYREISRKLGMPTGSIGPTRARSIAKLRGTPAVTTLIQVERGGTTTACA